MKQTTKKLAGLACGLALVLGCGAGTLTASATSVGDVIAHAYAVGLPESDIQACIAQYSGREYTSEQCDQAIAALDNWAKERDDKINEEINKGTTTAAPEENRTTETTAATAAAAAGKTAQTTAPAKKDFLNMTLNEKVEYINSLPADQRNDFVQNMSNEERNSFLKQMKTSDQLDVISAMTDVGKAFGVNFSVEDGEFVAVVGTSGSGKSTLLHMMGGLDTPTSGNVIVRDKELSKMNDEQLTIFRRRNIGFIFQNYNLVPILNVYENIVLPVELDGDTVDQKFLDEIVHLLGLEDKLKNMPNNLSGGQQQRVAIARALITKPAIVLADEPTGNLDSKTSAEVLGLIKRTSAEFRQTVVMITHNNDIARLADRIVRIEDGKIVE